MKKDKQEKYNFGNSSKKFDHENDSWWTKVQRRFVWIVLRFFYRAVYRIKIEGTENVPKDGAFVICGNHVDFAKVPVIAVPTSVGYGANLGGIAALLSMINSCSNGISVVNIDNGYGAGYIANQINKLAIKE